MRRITELVNQELKWEQPNSFKMEYDLLAGEEAAATLRFRSAFGSLAAAESADGCWTFKRVGFFRTHVSIRACDSEADLASFRNNTWTGGGALELPDGRRYPASTNFWMTQYEFRTETGEELFGYRKIGGLFHVSATVLIQPPAATIAELPWMVMLGWYLVILLQQDAAVAAAV